MCELLEALETNATDTDLRDRSWPKNAKALSNAVRRMETVLNETEGIVFEKVTSLHGRHIYRLSKPGDEGEDPTYPTPTLPAITHDSGRAGSVGSVGSVDSEREEIEI